MEFVRYIHERKLSSFLDCFLKLLFTHHLQRFCLGHLQWYNTLSTFLFMLNMLVITVNYNRLAFCNFLFLLSCFGSNLLILNDAHYPNNVDRTCSCQVVVTLDDVEDLGVELLLNVMNSTKFEFNRFQALVLLLLVHLFLYFFNQFLVKVQVSF